MEFFKPDLDIKFGKLFVPFATASLLVTFFLGVLIVYKIFITKDFNWGTDFSGGTELQVKFKDKVHVDQVRAILQKNGLGEASVIQFGEEGQNEILIRYKGETVEGNKVSQQVIGALQKEFGQEKVDLRRVDEVGPKVGKELKYHAILSLILGNLGIVVYIWFRFTPRFAPGALLSLVHDVITSRGFYTLTGHEFSLSILAALLTIVGYSIHDTIVIYDRIRDNMKAARRGDLEEVVVLSLNQMFGRTILTTALTLPSVIAIFVYTHGEVKDFAMIMMIGIVSGAYSTIFVATPCFIWIEKIKQFRAKQLRARTA